ncbi:MAG: amino acid ABC transporter permease [Acetobacteraceae bacterium]|nr:amino acid ABC transporter permease [Acetobacteraceae bacterium]
MRLSWADPRFRGLVWQVLIVGLVILVIWYLVSNTNANLAARHIATGFGFLSRVAGVPIADSPIPYNPAESTYGRALLIGVLNTLKVAVSGIILATLLGTLIGIGRLSSNWLVAKLAAIYVEVIRDIPVLLQLLFWYTLLQGLPGPRQAIAIGNWAFLSNRGIKVAVIDWQPGQGWSLLALVAGIALAFGYARYSRRRQERTGQKPRVWPVAIALMVLPPAAVWALAGGSLVIDKPVLRGFNFTGGTTISPEFVALLLGLVVYTAAYIAEIVRSGIEAVPQGQWEAGRALGLHSGVLLRKIVLPQALRVVVPPMTSQYLNLTKNSSLAVAIGFQDIVSVANTVLNQTGQAIEGIAMIMAVYLTISLSISLFMNWYNARIALVER